MNIFTGFILSSGLLISSTDIIQRFHKKYDNLKSVSLEFASAGISGTLNALKGGRYKIETRDRTIISDGKAVYNVQYSTKTAIINAYDSSLDDISVEKVLFTLLNIYRAEVIISTPKSVRIRLVPPDKEARVTGVDKVELTCSNNLIITSIDVFDGSSKVSWSINNLKLNQKIHESQFSFKPLKGWNIVDLR